MFTENIRTEIYKFLNKVFINGKPVQAIHSGTTALRPTVMPDGSPLVTGYDYFDTELQNSIWWGGSSWVANTSEKEVITVVTAAVTITAVQSNKYLKQIGGTGNINITADRFAKDTDLEGEVTTGTKTFVALTGMTLRGSILTITANQRYSIKFSTPTDALVTIIETPPRIITASVTLDFPAIAAGASATLTATVTGAALDDNINVSGPADIYSAGGRIDAWPSGTNTVIIRVKNDSGITIDPASGTFKLKVFK